MAGPVSVIKGGAFGQAGSRSRRTYRPFANTHERALRGPDHFVSGGARLVLCTPDAVRDAYARLFTRAELEHALDVIDGKDFASRQMFVIDSFYIPGDRR